MSSKPDATPATKAPLSQPPEVDKLTVSMGSTGNSSEASKAMSGSLSGASGKGSVNSRGADPNLFKASLTSMKSVTSSVAGERMLKGNRVSMFSSYSGVVHNADVEPIQYVVNRSNSRDMGHPPNAFPELHTVPGTGAIGTAKSAKSASSGSPDSSLHTRTSPTREPSILKKTLTTLHRRHHSDLESIHEPLQLPTSPSMSPSLKRHTIAKFPDIERAVSLQAPLPARSPRRPNSVYLSAAESPVESPSVSPTRRTSLMGPRTPPPLSPAPSVKHMRHGSSPDVFNSAVSSMGTHRRQSSLTGLHSHSRVSSKSSRNELIGTQITEIMQEVEDLRSEISSGAPSSLKITPQTGVQIKSSPAVSPALPDSATSSGEVSATQPVFEKGHVRSDSAQTSSDSFHTALSGGSSEDDEWVDEQASPQSEDRGYSASRSSSDDRPTEDLRLGAEKRLNGPSISTIKRASTIKRSSTLNRSSEPTLRRVSDQTTIKRASDQTTIRRSSSKKSSKRSSKRLSDEQQQIVAMKYATSEPLKRSTGSSKKHSYSSGESHAANMSGNTAGAPTQFTSSSRYSNREVEEEEDSSEEEAPDMFMKSVIGKRPGQGVGKQQKMKSFSFNTLAKLLNATDGIVIGQEFASLGMPNEERYLLEKIVGSLSKLTANMMISPNRYDQSCARLEKVLNVLEGFD